MPAWWLCIRYCGITIFKVWYKSDLLSGMYSLHNSGIGIWRYDKPPCKYPSHSSCNAIVNAFSRYNDHVELLWSVLNNATNVIDSEAMLSAELPLTQKSRQGVAYIQLSVQMMAWSTPKRYLNQRWLITLCALRQMWTKTFPTNFISRFRLQSNGNYVSSSICWLMTRLACFSITWTCDWPSGRTF